MLRRHWLHFWLAGCFVAGFWWFSYHAEPCQACAVEQVEIQAEQVPPIADGASESSTLEMTYHYDKVLVEAEVIPADVDAYKPAKDTRNTRYRILVGYFTDKTRAEYLVATLKANALIATIDSVTKASGADRTVDEKGYQVVIGPITSRSKMNSVKDRLVSLGLQPLVKALDGD